MTYQIRQRKEFTKQTKREALLRSGGFCEAVGPVYGLHEDQRCNAPLGNGLDFDHYDAIDNDDVSLENCRAVCRTCHGFKTPKDTTKHAKVKRISDKHHGIKKPSVWPKRKFSQPRYDNTKQIREELE